MKIKLSANIKVAAALLTAAGCVFGAEGADRATLSPIPASRDSVNDAAAVVIASNINMALNEVFYNLRCAGLDVDSAVVMDKVKTMIPAPYDSVTHRAAAQVLSDEAARFAAIMNDLFLLEARHAQGATKLPSGVIMRVISEGEDEDVSPSDSATVSFYYEGILPDGTVFDSVRRPAEPLKSDIKNFVPGLTEALGHMRKGWKYDVVIPAPLAYGANGVGGVIPPDCPLRFVVELVDFD